MDYKIIWNFMSPQTGRILCDPDHVLVGDANGVAVPSLYIPTGALPNLTYKHLWIGDNSNRPVETMIITIDNLPDLGVGIIPPVTGLGKIWRGTISGRPVESDALSLVEIEIIDIQGEIASINITLASLATAITALTASVAALEVEVSNLTSRMNAVEILAKYGSKPYINIYLHNNAVSMSILANVWTKIQGVTTINSASEFISPTDNTIQYNDTHPINTLATLNVSAFTDLGTNGTLGIAIVRNSVLLLPVNYAFQPASATQVSMSLTTYVSFTNNTDHIEAYILCDQACNIVCSEMSFSVATL